MLLSHTAPARRARVDSDAHETVTASVYGPCRSDRPGHGRRASRLGDGEGVEFPVEDCRRVSTRLACFTMLAGVEDVGNQRRCGNRQPSPLPVGAPVNYEEP